MLRFNQAWYRTACSPQAFPLHTSPLPSSMSLSRLSSPSPYFFFCRGWAVRVVNMKTESVHLKGWQPVRDSRADTSACDTLTERTVEPEAIQRRREEGRSRKGEGNKVIECCGAGAGEWQMPNNDRRSVSLCFDSSSAVSEISPLDTSPFPTSHWSWNLSFKTFRNHWQFKCNLVYYKLNWYHPNPNQSQLYRIKGPNTSMNIEQSTTLLLFTQF